MIVYLLGNSSEVPSEAKLAVQLQSKIRQTCANLYFHIARLEDWWDKLPMSDE